jgi:cytidylate kinase
MIIVIDGPAGSGKSSTAKAVAEIMHIEYLDSGALYRALTWIYLQVNQDRDLFFSRLKHASIVFYYADKLFHVSVDEKDITDQLRRKEVSDLVSIVASFPQARTFVDALMQDAVRQGQYIAEGRDLGTAVFPKAALKFFMKADPEERARRRFKELEASGADITLDEVRRNIHYRDREDANRETDPLKMAADAIEIDTTDVSFQEQVQQICMIIHKKTNLIYKP